ncbi:SDR family oxidoreductase [Actinoplanes sp. TBRC 11911]|uniref:SDR family oxidoreductase n=1 Tax=Actinoplanes sp. TBRC 11911 TaxID=2729386 RepID=UPI00145C7728|nr:SDR family oxidoreductase [Actinoplanes sp. TBRC 11911]NMO49669.1 SDR family oxidoreductase [Actinoplanes sp. TBRC 11911]
MDLGLARRVFILDGDSSGLGFATARELVGEGARVVISDRGEAGVAAAVDRLGGPEHAAGVAGDLADQDMPRQLAGLAIRRFGRLDGALLSVSGRERWKPALGAARALADDFGNDGAIAMSLPAGPCPRLSGVAVEIAGEFAARQVRFLGLIPGRMSPMPAAETSRIPLRRGGRPSEFARVAAFALSPAASTLTGVIIPVDGGASSAT